jgi:hypothetical protein
MPHRLFPRTFVLLLAVAGIAAAKGSVKSPTKSAKPSQPSPYLLPPPGGGDVCPPNRSDVCKTSSGCSGTTTCNRLGTGWGPCTLDSNSTRSCTTCGDGGTQVCRTDGSYGSCQPPNPSNELCNSCDDDKDGIVDNVIIGFPLCSSGWCTVSGGAACVNGAWTCSGVPGGSCTKIHGACSTAGHFACDGSGVCIANAQETCNGIDDDCDGFVDDAPNSDGSYTLSRACSNAINPNHCSVNHEMCTSSGWAGVCTACGGTGTCSTCTGSSKPGQGTATCDATCNLSGVCSGPEVCNDCDDNGSGIADEGVNCAPCNL